MCDYPEKKFWSFVAVCMAIGFCVLVTSVSSCEKTNIEAKARIVESGADPIYASHLFHSR
jgi:hypothetical protein